MNFLQIFSEIEKEDPEFYERTSERRGVIKNWSRRIGLTALPFALGSLFNKAYGKTTDLVVDTLNFALTLEYLEAEFYQNAVGAIGLIPLAAQDQFQTIYQQENYHVIFLKSAITAAGGVPIVKPVFDFTGGNGSGNGPFAGVFSNYASFLELSQTFEDTGVRAYKGQAVNLMGNDTVLTTALNIHSVEARHAAYVRGQRSAVKPWITQNQAGTTTTLNQASYDGEENTIQAGVQINGINGKAISANTASEAFDEPLTMQQILDIVAPFIV